MVEGYDLEQPVHAALPFVDGTAKEKIAYTKAVPQHEQIAKLRAWFKPGRTGTYHACARLKAALSTLLALLACVKPYINRVIWCLSVYSEK